MAITTTLKQFQSVGPEKIWNIVFSRQARAIKALDSYIVTPSSLITSDISAAPTYVGNGNLIRIRVTATTYVAFGPSTMTAPSVTTQNALELFSAGTYLIMANDDYIMASVNPARVEVITGNY